MEDRWSKLEKDLLTCKRTYQLARWLLSPGMIVAGSAWLMLLPPGSNITTNPRGVGIGVFLVIAGVLLWGVFHRLCLRYTYKYWQCIRHQRGQDSDPEKFWKEDGGRQAFYKW
jgi:hypothetical protein